MAALIQASLVQYTSTKEGELLSLRNTDLWRLRNFGPIILQPVVFKSQLLHGKSAVVSARSVSELYHFISLFLIALSLI